MSSARELIEAEMLLDGETWQERHYPVPMFISGHPGTVHDIDTTKNRHYPHAMRIVKAEAAERVIERLQKRGEELEKRLRDVDLYFHGPERERYRERLDRMVAAMTGTYPFESDEVTVARCAKKLAAIDAEVERHELR